MIPKRLSALGNLFKMHISCRKPVPCGLSRQTKECLLLLNQPNFVLWCKLCETQIPQLIIYRRFLVGFTTSQSQVLIQNWCTGQGCNTELYACFLDWQAMLTKAGRLTQQKVFLVNIAWIHRAHILLCCPTNMILVWLGGICHGKDNCLHVLAILFSADRVVIRFPLSTNSSNMRHIVFLVFCWQKLYSQWGKLWPQGECNYAADCSPSSHRDEANEEEETS